MDISKQSKRTERVKSIFDSDDSDEEEINKGFSSSNSHEDDDENNLRKQIDDVCFSLSDEQKAHDNVDSKTIVEEILNKDKIESQSIPESENKDEMDVDENLKSDIEEKEDTTIDPEKNIVTNLKDLPSDVMEEPQDKELEQPTDLPSDVMEELQDKELEQQDVIRSFEEEKKKKYIAAEQDQLHSDSEKEDNHEEVNLKEKIEEKTSNLESNKSNVDSTIIPTNDDNISGDVLNIDSSMQLNEVCITEDDFKLLKHQSGLLEADVHAIEEESIAKVISEELTTENVSTEVDSVGVEEDKIIDQSDSSEKLEDKRSQSVEKDTIIDKGNQFVEKDTITEEKIESNDVNEPGIENVTENNETDDTKAVYEEEIISSQNDDIMKNVDTVCTENLEIQSKPESTFSSSPQALSQEEIAETCIADDKVMQEDIGNFVEDVVLSTKDDDSDVIEDSNNKDPELANLSDVWNTVNIFQGPNLATVSEDNSIKEPTTDITTTSQSQNSASEEEEEETDSDSGMDVDEDKTTTTLPTISEHKRKQIFGISANNIETIHNTSNQNDDQSVGWDSVKVEPSVEFVNDELESLEEQRRKKVRVEDIFTDSDAEDKEDSPVKSFSIKEASVVLSDYRKGDEATSPKKLRRKRDRATSINLPAIMMAFEKGWIREVCFRSATGMGTKKADVYYYSPEQKKLRSRTEVQEYLSLTGSDLTLQNFSFFKEPLGVGERYEKIRYAMPLGNKKAAMVSKVVIPPHAAFGAPLGTPPPLLPRKRERTLTPKARDLVPPAKRARNKEGSVKKVMIKEATVKLPYAPPENRRLRAIAPKGKPAPSSNAAVYPSHVSPAKKLPAAPPVKTRPIAPKGKPMLPSSNAAVYSTHLSPANPPLTHARILTPVIRGDPRSLHCTPMCDGVGGAVPNLNCVKCLRLFHPQCCQMPPATLPLIVASMAKFLCPNCYHDEVSSASSKSPSDYGAVPFEPLAFDPDDRYSDEDEGLVSDYIHSSYKHVALRPPSPILAGPMPAHLMPSEGLPNAMQETFVQPSDPYMIYGTSASPAREPLSKDSEVEEGLVKTEQEEGDGDKNLKVSGAVSGFRGSAFLMGDLALAYGVMKKIFVHLPMRDLLKAMSVCHLWRDVALQPQLWNRVRLASVCVSDWSSLASFLDKRGTVCLDLSGVALAAKASTDCKGKIEKLEKEERIEEQNIKDKENEKVIEEVEEKIDDTVEEKIDDFVEEEIDDIVEEEIDDIVEEKADDIVEKLEKEDEDENKEGKELQERVLETPKLNEDEDSRMSVVEAGKDNGEMTEFEKMDVCEEVEEMEVDEKEEAMEIEEKKEEEENKEDKEQAIRSQIFSEHDYFVCTTNKEIENPIKMGEEKLGEEEEELSLDDLEDDSKGLSDGVEEEVDLEGLLEKETEESDESDSDEDSSDTSSSDEDEEGENDKEEEKEEIDKEEEKEIETEESETILEVAGKEDCEEKEEVKETPIIEEMKENAIETREEIKEDETKEIEKDLEVAEEDENSQEETTQEEDEGEAEPELELSEKDVWFTIGSKLSCVRSLREIRICGVGADVIESLLSALGRQLTVFEAEDIQSSEQNDITLDPSVLMQARDLETLTLTSLRNFTFVSNFNFIKLPKLKSLTLHGLKTSEMGWPYLGTQLTQLRLGPVNTFSQHNWANLTAMTGLEYLSLDGAASEQDADLCFSLTKLPQLRRLALLDWNIGSRLPHTIKRMPNVNAIKIVPANEPQSLGGVFAGRLMVILETSKHLQQFAWGVQTNDIIHEEGQQKIRILNMKAGKETGAAEGEEVRLVPLDSLQGFVKCRIPQADVSVYTANAPLAMTDW